MSGLEGAQRSFPCDGLHLPRSPPPGGGLCAVGRVSSVLHLAGSYGAGIDFPRPLL